MSWPRTRAEPESGRSSVASIRIVVVLPAPLGPSIPYTAPFRTDRSTPSTALVSPKDFDEALGLDGKLVGAGHALTGSSSTGSGSSNRSRQLGDRLAVALDLERPGRLGGPELLPVVEDSDECHRVGFDHGVRVVGLTVLNLERSTLDAKAKRFVAKAQADGEVEPVRLVGQEHRLEVHRERAGAEVAGVGEVGRAGCPVAEGAEGRLELAAPLGELINLGRRRGRERTPAADDAVSLELAKALGEHVRARGRQARADVGEALGPVAQLAQDQDRPALTHQLERVGEPAEVVVRALLGGHRGYIYTP